MKINKSRFWNGLLVAAGAIVCALALSLANRGIVGAEAGASDSGQVAKAAAVQTEIYEGMITDTRCGAKHSAVIGMGAADCARVCVHGGERFALVDGEALYPLEGETSALKRVAGQRVRITGKLNGNRIAVASVAPAS
jgi:hypothetical protein